MRNSLRCRQHIPQMMFDILAPTASKQKSNNCMYILPWDSNIYVYIHIHICIYIYTFEREREREREREKKKKKRKKTTKKKKQGAQEKENVQVDQSIVVFDATTERSLAIVCCKWLCFQTTGERISLQLILVHNSRNPVECLRPTSCRGKTTNHIVKRLSKLIQENHNKFCISF